MTDKPIREQFADTMLAVGQEDERLVVMVGDISHGVLKPFAKSFPDRYYNIGILEPTMVSVGAGLARAGLHPVIHTIAPFLIERSFEQIKLDFCYHRLSGNIVTVGSAFDYAYLGCTHHCYGDFALLKTLEGVQIVYPSTAREFDLLFRQAYSNTHLTVYRIPAHSHGVSFPDTDIQLGKGIKLADGKDVTLIATGTQLKTAKTATLKLIELECSCDVIYIHTIRPLDHELILQSVSKTKHVIVIEEHMRSGGLGDDVLRVIRDLPTVRYESISIPDEFIRNHASYQDHCEQVGLTPDKVIDVVSRWKSDVA